MAAPLFQTRVKLPALIVDKKTVAGNKILQLAQPEQIIDVSVFAHDSSETYRLTDRFGRTFYLKARGARADINGVDYLLKGANLSEIKDLNEETKLKWEHHHRSEAPKDASEIVKSWDQSFSFAEENLATGKPGLREPQAGALHAIAAHWSVSSECSTIVMPTGTGKTEVMLSTLVSKGCERVLVIVPSTALRDQTFDKFTSLGRLADIGAIPDKSFLPRVAKVKGGIRNRRDVATLLENSNVIIAIPAALNQFSDECLQDLVSGCTHLFVDEAHHKPAPTWKRITDAFGEKPILQFTATPFRQDSKRIEGRIIYDYPLGLAQEREYFKPINLIKLNEIDDSKADEEIAKKAIETLKADLGKDLEHLVMARTDDVGRANHIHGIYKRLGAEYDPLIVHHQLTSSEKASALQKIKNGKSRIVICVNMLGEGFDLPNLKIAAIHDLHKSLAITLQFIGRFTRVATDKIGEATVVVNTADVRVDKSLEALYAQNPDWNLLLRQKSESAIRREKDLQDVILNFRGELSKQISLWNLRPSFSTLIFRTKCEEWDPKAFEEALPKQYERWYAINEEEKILVVVISREEDVKWGKYKDIKKLSFDLCVMKWNKAKRALFVQCSDYDVFNYTSMAKKVCGDDVSIVDGHGLFNVFSSINHPMVQNLGATKTGTISYTMYFGPEVTTGLSDIERAESTPNNIFAWGYENGERVTYGCSAKSGKLWSRGGGTIIDWREWCEIVETKIATGSSSEAEIIKGFLKPKALNGRHKSVAIGAEWGERLLQNPEHSGYVFFGSDEYQLFDVDLNIVKHSEDGPIHVLFSTEDKQSEYKITFTRGADSGKCTYEHVGGPTISIKRSNHPALPLAEYIVRDPIVIRYADGSFSYNNYHVATPAPENFFDKDKMEAIDWTVDIRSESQGKEQDTNTIQYQTTQMILDDYDIILNDDGSGESADIVALRKDSDESYSMRLFHCKFSRTDDPSGDIENLYQVCGQAQKSIRWKHSGLEAFVDHVKKREQKWRAGGHTRFIKGTMDDLINLRKFSRFAKLNFSISIVQPGLSKAKTSSGITQLLSCTDNYLVKTTGSSLKVFCSK